MTDPGLCAGCRHGREIRSDRGSVFWLCRRSATDPRFPRYPALPVRACPGYEPEAAEADDDPTTEREPPPVP